MVEQKYKFSTLDIPEVVLIEPFFVNDERGSVLKGYSKEAFLSNGINFIPVENLNIKSKAGVIRGLHFQRLKEQAKLIGCIYGRLWVVFVDLRPESEYFGKWGSCELNLQTELYIPKGCALGTLALEDTLISYLSDEKFYAEYDDGIKWDDADLDINWPLDFINGQPIISLKDKNLQNFSSFVSSMKGR